MSDTFSQRIDPAIDFYQRLHHYTPRLWVTPTLIVLNVVVFAVMVLKGVDPMSPLVDDLIKWGANYGPLTTQGQWWRLLTSTFIHIGLLHIFVNMYALWNLGRFVEKLFGQTGFIIVYVLSGLAASLTTTTWNPQVTSAGASGAIFGIFGAIFGYLLRTRRTMPGTIFKSLLRSGGLFLVINLGIGLSVPHVDMSAHVGGLIAGFALSLLISGPMTDAGFKRRALRNIITLIVGAAAVWFYADTLKPIRDFNSAWENSVLLEEKSNALMEDALKKEQAGLLTPAQYTEVLRTQVLPQVVAARKELEGFELGATQARLQTLMMALLRAREEELTSLADAIASNDAGAVALLNKKTAERERRNAALTAYLNNLGKH